MDEPVGHLQARLGDHLRHVGECPLTPLERLLDRDRETAPLLNRGPLTVLIDLRTSSGQPRGPINNARERAVGLRADGS